jgi:acetyl esterase/lipase
MKTVLKYTALCLAVLLLAAMGYGVWWVFLDGRAPAKRPDLVRLPVDAPQPPKGFPTFNAGMLAFATGQLELLDIRGEVDLSGVKVEENVEYGNANGRPLLLDLYQPETPPAAPVPGLIFIHGGGWAGGDKKDYKYYTARFARKGYTVISVGYRFTPEFPFPACVQDVKCAVRWFRENAARLNVDPNRIVAIGGSAGGHLSMMLGYSSDVPELEGDSGHAGVSSAVAAVVDLYGPVDLTTPDAVDNSTVTRFFKESYAVNPDAYRLASPLTHLDPKDPPTLIMHGTIDQVCTVLQGDLLAEKLQELKMPYWYDRLDGFPHTMDLILSVNERTQWMIQRFLETHLPGGTAPVK